MPTTIPTRDAVATNFQPFNTDIEPRQTAFVYLNHLIIFVVVESRDFGNHRVGSQRLNEGLQVFGVDQLVGLDRRKGFSGVVRTKPAEKVFHLLADAERFGRLKSEHPQLREVFLPSLILLSLLRRRQLG